MATVKAPNIHSGRTRLGRDEFQEDDLGEIRGGQTGEADGDTVPGGWEGSDDATSTAPSDLSPQPFRNAAGILEEESADASIGRAYGGGLGSEDGGITDIKGTPIEGSRDWEHDAI